MFSLKSINLRAFIMLLALIGLCLFFHFATDGIFLSTKNITNLTRQSAIVGILATGMVLVIISGNIDLSIGSLVGFTGCTAAIFLTKAEWGLPLVLLTTLFLGIIIGALQGSLVAYARIPAFIVTLGGLMIFRGLVKGVSMGETITVNERFQFLGSGFLSETQGWIITGVIIVLLGWFYFTKIKNSGESKKILPNIIPFIIYSGLIITLITIFNNNDIKFPSSPEENDKSIPMPVVILVGVVFLFHFITQKTVFGRRIYAIGGNQDAAWLSGINIKWNTLVVFMISGALSALAGIIYTARVGSASADAGKNLELDAVAACVIGGASLMGGKGSVGGVIIGALFMACLDNGMSIMNIEDFYQDIIKGIVLVTAVYLDVAGKKK